MRLSGERGTPRADLVFPFFLGRAFIEALHRLRFGLQRWRRFPFLFGGAFIEAPFRKLLLPPGVTISLPSGKGFH